MAFNNGPKIDTRGLVFAFDREVPRAFAGEPTVNLIPDPYLLLHEDTFVGAASIVKTSFGNGLTGVTWTQGSTADIVSVNFLEPGTLVSGETYTLSTYLHSSKVGALAKTQATIYVDGVRYWLTNSNQWTGSTVECSHLISPTLSNQWHRVDVQFTAPVGVLTQFSIGAFYRNAPDFVLKIANVQLEQKTRPTPFTATQRSDADTYTDLSGYGSVIDASNASYGSDGLLQLSGSSEFILLPQRTMYDGVFPTSGSFTIDIWANKDAIQSDVSPMLFKYSSTLGNPGITIVNYQATTSSTTTSDYGFIVEYSDNALADSATGGELFSNRNNAVNTLGWHNYTVAYNVSGTSHTGSVYHDGVLIKEVSSSVAYQWAKPVTPLSSGPLFGYNNSGSVTTTHQFGGEISSIRIYNRALSATEVLQNYNATKGRFL